MMINLTKLLTIYLDIKTTAINKSDSLNITKAKINVCFIQSIMPPVTTTEHETTLDLEAIKISWGRTQFPFRTHDFQLVICLKSPTAEKNTEIIAH